MEKLSSEPKKKSILRKKKKSRSSKYLSFDQSRFSTDSLINLKSPFDVKKSYETVLNSIMTKSILSDYQWITDEKGGPVVISESSNSKLVQAKNRRLKNLVTVKIIPKKPNNIFDQTPNLSLFDIKAHLSVKNANLLEPIAWNEDAVNFYIVLEHFEGCSLGKYIRTSPFMDEQSIASIFMQISSVIYSLKTKQFVMNSITTDCFLIDKFKNIRLWDLSCLEESTDCFEMVGLLGKLLIELVLKEKNRSLKTVLAELKRRTSEDLIDLLEGMTEVDYRLTIGEVLKHRWLARKGMTKKKKSTKLKIKETRKMISFELKSCDREELLRFNSGSKSNSLRKRKTTSDISKEMKVEIVKETKARVDDERKSFETSMNVLKKAQKIKEGKKEEGFWNGCKQMFNIFGCDC